MKIKEIRTILKAQTCNLFSEEWYNKTSSLLSGLNKEAIDNPVKIDSRFEKFQIGVKYYNSEIKVEFPAHIKTFLSQLNQYCVSQGRDLMKGRDFKGRFLLIQEKKHD